MRDRYFTILKGLFFLLIFTTCNPKNEFILVGEFHLSDPSPVELYLLRESESVLVDSVFTEGKTFKISGPIDHPSIYLLKFFNEQTTYLVIHPGDKIKIEIDNTMDEITYYVENSPDSKYIKELTDQQNKVLKQIDQLSTEWENNRGDTLIRQMIDSTYFDLLIQHQNYTRNFIMKHPESLANILALYQNLGGEKTQLYDKYDDLDIFNFVDSMLTPLYPETEAVIALNRSLSETKEQIRRNTLIEKKVEVGYPLPETHVGTLAGDSITIGASGSTLLLFWASWNKYSVKELKLIQNYYNEMKNNNGVDIITVSLDSSEEKLREFMNELNITVPVVCDYRFWDSELVARYVVKRIPAVIIANRKGKVIARDVFSDELIAQLSDLQ